MILQIISDMTSKEYVKVKKTDLELLRERLKDLESFLSQRLA